MDIEEYRKELYELDDSWAECVRHNGLDRVREDQLILEMIGAGITPLEGVSYIYERYYI